MTTGLAADGGLWPENEKQALSIERAARAVTGNNSPDRVGLFDED